MLALRITVAVTTWALSLALGTGAEPKTGGSIRINWPDDVAGHYAILGLTDREGIGAPGGKESSSLTVALPNGRWRLVGPGFDMGIITHGEDVSLYQNNSDGAVFDRDARTLTFASTPVTVVLNGLDLAVTNPGNRDKFDRRTGDEHTFRIARTGFNSLRQSR
jgi:hypothetical protein